MRISNLRLFVGFYLLLAGTMFAFSQASGAAKVSDESARKSVIQLVAQIRNADYEDNLAALSRLYTELGPFADNKTLGSRVRYSRGFALWRRAINGFNDAADPKEMEQNVSDAVNEFDQAIAADPGFVDAKVGGSSCLMMLAFTFPNRDQATMQEWIAKSRKLLTEAYTTAPENPRMLWVRGGATWYTPPERGGGQAPAMATYEKGLEYWRQQNKTASDPLEPSWGGPELLMSLAWSNLNRTTPDLNAAEQEALEALKMAPNWHYTRDILLKQIRDAKTAPQK